MLDRSLLSCSKRLIYVLPVAVLAMTGTHVLAADYHVERIEVLVEAWPRKAWDFVRVFCVPEQLDEVEGTCVAGDGGVGTIRLLADGTRELLVALGPLSYTYEAIAGPLAAADLHGTIMVTPLDNPLLSTYVGFMIWDAEEIPEDRRLAVQYEVRGRLMSLLRDAKSQAEAS